MKGRKYGYYLLANPKYQDNGIGRNLLKKVKEKYSNYLYLILIAENDALVDYYKKEGFDVVENTVAMTITKVI